MVVRGESEVYSYGDGYIISPSMRLKDEEKWLVRQHFGGQPTLMVAGCECWYMMLHTGGKHHVQDSTTVLHVVVSN